MECILDWCSLTIKKIYGKPATWEKVVSEVLEMDFGQFTELKGNYGYKLQKYSEGIRVYYDGNEDMGIHLQISGDGMRRLENRKNFTWDSFLRNAFFFDAKITRLDVAIDDKEGYINMETLNDKINKGECISKFKSCNTIHKQLISNGETAGKTIN
ncbi:MAG: replication initiation factor domain-containing protein, partial [Thermoplasmata archaeon]